MFRRSTRSRKFRFPIAAEFQLLERRCLLSGVMDPNSAYIEAHNDRIPNFAQNPTIVAQASGNWSDVSIWSEGRTPVAGDIIRISEGVTVIYDLVSDQAIEAIGVEGELRFATNQDTRLTVGTLLVYEHGILEVGSVDQPISAGVLAEILIADQPIDLAADPEQWGTGILAFGIVRIHGHYQNETFVRLASEPRLGDRVLVLGQAVQGWQVGDRLYLPDSHQRQWFEKNSMSHQGEYLEIAAISQDGLQITLTAPLQHNHLGARDADGNLDFLPHVANQTRNVQIRSANPAGTRGHVAVFERADLDVRYAEFMNLGRTTVAATDNTTFDQNGTVTHIGTNQSGRYALHIHHLMGPTATPENGYQFTLIGNSLSWQENAQFKWGIVLHGSHYGLVQQNIVQGANDSGIVTEDGTESFNVFEENFVADTWTAKGRMHAGAFWFRGFNNIIRNNVAVNVYTSSVESAYGFTFYGEYLGQLKIPAFPGADIQEGEFLWIDGNATPIREFRNNEVYASESGLTIWWLNTFFQNPRNGGTTVIDGLKIWHVHHHGYYGYPSNDLVFDGTIIRGDTAAGDSSLPMGFFFSDYFTRNNVIRHADIQGMRIGVFLPAFAADSFRLEDSFLRNRVNVLMQTKWSVNGGEQVTPSAMVLDNVRFEPLPGFEFITIALSYSASGNRNVIQRDQLFVYNYDGQADQDFQVFYEQQHPDFIVPQTGSNTDGGRPVLGSPVAGLTNSQNWARYGIAIAGAVAPVATGTPIEIPEIHGALVFRPSENQPSYLALSTPSVDSIEGDSGITVYTFTLERGGEATSSVSVDWVVTGSGADAADFSGGVLPTGTVTFASGETLKTITISVAGDLAIESDETFLVSLIHPSSGAEITTGFAQGIIRNDDQPGILVSPTSGLSTSESGGTASFTVVLTRPPTANVVLAVTSQNVAEGRVSISQLVFTPSNWNDIQTVIVTGVDDRNKDGNIPYLIVLGSVQSSDPNYQGLDPVDVQLTNLDNEKKRPSGKPNGFSLSGTATTQSTKILDTDLGRPQTPIKVSGTSNTSGSTKLELIGMDSVAGVNASLSSDEMANDQLFAGFEELLGDLL